MHNNQNENCPPWYQDCLSVTMILAACFSAKEIKRLCRLAGWNEFQGETNPARFLEILHGACHSEDRVVKGVEKALNKRFRSARSKVRSSSVEQIEKLWDEVNWPIPIFWAVLSDERSGVRLLGRSFCHALIWKAGRGLAANSADEAYEDQAQVLAEDNIRLNKDVLNLRRELNRSLAEAAKTPVVPVPITREAEEETAALKRELKGLRKELANTKEINKDLEKKQAVSRRLLFAENEYLQGALVPIDQDGCPAASIPPPPDCPRQDGRRCQTGEECRECPLQGLRVAIVGGLERMEPKYRDLVRRMGGRLCYHTGHIRSGTGKLRRIVNRADIVIFITTVNSHGALSAVKDSCKKTSTPLATLGQTGVDSLEKALRRIAA